MKPARLDLAVRVMRDQRILAEAMGRSSGVAEAFLRHEGCAEPPPRLDAGDAPHGAAADPDRFRWLRKALAGEDGEEFALAVAGDAGDADDFAGTGRQGRCLGGHSVHAARPAAPRDLSTRSALACAAAGVAPARTSPTSRRP